MNRQALKRTTVQVVVVVRGGARERGYFKGTASFVNARLVNLRGF